MNYIKSLHIEGFKKFTSLDVEFNEHMNILVGENEAAKSTILDAIKTALNQQYRNADKSILRDLFNTQMVAAFKAEPSIRTLPRIYIEVELALDPQQKNASYFYGEIYGERKQQVEKFGIRFECKYDEELGTGMEQSIQEGKIPYEYYTLTWTTFANRPYQMIKRPLNFLAIDTTSSASAPSFNYFNRTLFTSRYDDATKAKANQANDLQHIFVGATVDEWTWEACIYKENKDTLDGMIDVQAGAAYKFHDKDYGAVLGILPSEKAFAYKMKLDALNHQGITSGQVGQKWSREKMADEALDSGRQIQRYIRLTYLIPELLSMVDDGKIAFNPAVELSYLDSYQQRAVLDAMVLNDCTPSHAQSIRLKKLAQEGLLDDQMIYAVLAETKPNQQEQLKFKREELRKYFPSGYTEEQMRRDIIKGLELLKRQRERNRNAR